MTLHALLHTEMEEGLTQWPPRQMEGEDRGRDGPPWGLEGGAGGMGWDGSRIEEEAI